MKLHLNKTQFTDSVKITSQQMNIPEIYVEKDYWVTFALHTIFNNPIGKETIFKGGTALSKCFGLIDRFSEDIDLVVRRNEGESNSRLTNKIRKITGVISEVLPEVEFDGITHKRGMNRKTVHSYAKLFEGEFGQVRDMIIVEATWFGSSEPFVTKEINSFIYEMMIANGQQQMVEKFELLPFDVSVLEPKRTICEKIMSLVRFSYTENRIEDLKKKVRHTYDLFQLLRNEELSDYFDSDEFEKMLIKVANDDVESFKNNNDWLKYHPNKAKIFNELDSVWDELKFTYAGEFRDLVYGDFPKEENIYGNLLRIKERLLPMEWTIKIV